MQQRNQLAKGSDLDSSSVARGADQVRYVQRDPNDAGIVVSAQTVEVLAVLDFEATCLENVRIDPQEIIEFPIVLVDVKTRTTIAEFHIFPANCFTPTLLKDAETLDLSVSSVAKPAADYVNEFFKFIPFPTLADAEKRLDEANKAANKAPSYSNLKWHRAEVRGRFGPAASTSPDDTETKKRSRSKKNNVSLPGQVATEYMKGRTSVSREKITAQLTAFVRQLESDEAVRTHVKAAAALLREGKKVDFSELQFPLFQVSARSNQQHRVWVEGQASAPFAGPFDHGGLTASLVKVAMSNINTADLATADVAAAYRRRLSRSVAATLNRMMSTMMSQQRPLHLKKRRLSQRRRASKRQLQLLLTAQHALGVGCRRTRALKRRRRSFGCASSSIRHLVGC
jgi:hypothetical protein